jgi:RecA-family ATPase
MKERPDINDTLRAKGPEGVRRRHDKARKFTNGTGEHNDGETLPYVDMSAWDDTPAPPRQWVIADRIPLLQPTLLSGEGAIGKSILLLQLLSSTPLARDWIGMLPEQGPAIYLGAEDTVDELHRRLEPILEHHKVRFADLIAGGFKLLSYAGKDAVLGEVERNGRIKPTALFEKLYRDACALRPKLIAIDTVSDAFLGDEIKRDQVRQFGGMMRRLAIDSTSGVVMSSHPSLTGINSGTGLSGSTQWHNTVRARAYFRKAESDDDEESSDKPDSGLRVLEFKKNQYGPVGSTVRLRWQNGLWLPVPSATFFENVVGERKADDLFLTLLDRFTKQGQRVSHNSSRTYAPALFAQHPDAKGFNKDKLAKAMQRLLDTGKISIAEYGPPSHRRSHLVLA